MPKDVVCIHPGPQGREKARRKMEVHKVVVLIIDHDEIGSEEVKAVIENVRYPNRCISPEVSKIETAEIGEWRDDHPLNSYDLAPTEWARLFPSLEAAQPHPAQDPAALQLLPYCENQVTLINEIPLAEYKALAEQLAALVLKAERIRPAFSDTMIAEIHRLAAIVAGSGE